MAELSEQQQEVVGLDDDVFVIACPGSGKTRVLTEKIASVLEAGIPNWKRVAAVTFTNRAADEIAFRVLDGGYSRKQLWTGTIHAFALEWILRPYASYDGQLSKGFAVADAFYVRKQLDALKEQFGVQYPDQVRLGYDREGNLLAEAEGERELVTECRRVMRESGLIDFDCILYLAYSLLTRRPEISRTLGAIFNHVCIDEYQDTQDLQFGILSSIVRSSNGAARIFIVGDKNQAIYTSLGGIAKTIKEVKEEFDRPNIMFRELSGNYRSTQRIVDFSSSFCEGDGIPIQSLAKHADEQGLITFDNQRYHKDELAEAIARIVQHHLDNGIAPADICILGPAWWLVTHIGRQMLLQLPRLELDAPGLSPLKYQPDSTWFKLARLFLSEPAPSRYRSRFRWASDFVLSLESEIGRELPEEIRTSRAILRLVNSITSEEESGLAYLDEVFDEAIAALEIDLDLHDALRDARHRFFEGAEERLIDRGDTELETVENLKKMFRYPAGLVVNTCHGVKGDEFTVVVCFGLLKGYVPHWSRIMDAAIDDGEEARRILYVVASRAKKYLHLFSESGRETRNRYPYSTTQELSGVVWEYDTSNFD